MHTGIKFKLKCKSQGKKLLILLCGLCRISQDTDFFNGQIEKVKELYKTAILPELLAKWYTRPAVIVQSRIVMNHLFWFAVALHAYLRSFT